MDKNIFAKLRTYAINLMLIGSNLYELVNSLEKDCTDDVPPEYRVSLVKGACEHRRAILKEKYKVIMGEKEANLWKKLMKDIDPPTISKPFETLEDIHNWALNSLDHEDYC